MAAPSSNKKAKLAATPDKPPAPTGKMIASAQARTTDWYVGIDWREEQGFDRNNPHRLALNDLMRGVCRLVKQPQRRERWGVRTQETSRA